jgi:hypothetical protein
VIKALGTHNGKTILVMGLSGENMTRLMAKEPIAFDISLPPGTRVLTVIIAGGRTEDAITADLRAHGLLPPEGAA